MEEIMKFQNYQEYKRELDLEMNRAAESFVRIGFLLKMARDTDILAASGYESLAQFAEKEYNLRPDQVSRFIQINDRFASGGYSDHLEERYAGVGYTKLVEMLQLPDTVTEELTGGLTREEIREVRSEFEEEKKVTDLERLMEQTDTVLQEMSNIEKVLYHLMKEETELFRKIHAWKNGEGTLKEILAPDGEKIYSVRVPGAGRYMLFLKEKEYQAALVNVRTNEKEFCTWEEMEKIMGCLVAPCESAEESYEKLYHEKLPAEAKRESVPEKPAKSGKTKESKVRKAEAPERKAEPKPEREPEPEMPGKKPDTVAENAEPAAGHKEETENIEKNEEAAGHQEKETDPNKDPDVAAGHTGEEDMPAEPEVESGVKIVPAQPEQTAERQETDGNLTEPLQGEQDCPYGTRKDYLDGCTEYGIASYLKKNLDIDFFRKATVEQLEKWFLEDVDDRGREIEEI